MSRPTPGRARQLAAELKRQFAQDAELARKLNDAHQSLQRANNRLWCGLHPDAIAAVYDQHPAAVNVAFAENRSEVLGAPDPLQAIQQIHWQIHKAHCDYQQAAENRRQLAPDIGEITRTCLDELVAAGWSETEARDANIRELAASHRGGVAMVNPDDDLIEEILACSRDRAQRFERWLEHLRSDDPGFAEASALYPDDMGEWQAAAYLLTGCDEVWATLGASVLADRSIAPVLGELEKPRREWSSSETQVMRWAAHFWDTERWDATFPYEFEEFYYHRWVAAGHLRKHIPPMRTIAAGGTHGAR